MAAFLVYNQRKGIRYMVRRRILGFAIGKMLRQDGWLRSIILRISFM